MGEILILILLLFSPCTHAQSPPRGDTPVEVITSEEPVSCSGSVAGAVVVTIIVIIIAAGIAYCLFKYKRRSNSVKHKIDPECGTIGGYDNPHFIGDEGCENDKAKNVNPSIKTESTSAVKSTATNTSGTLDRGKSAIEKVLSAVTGGVRIGSSPKIQDDCRLEARQTLVPLQGRDFSGLGFTIIGNMKEGIYVKDVLLRGPASESGKVATGNKIIAVTVLMDHMVYEDAHSILSYASPYPVILHLENGKPLSSPFSFKGKISPSSSKLKASSKNSSDVHKGCIAHPKLCKSQSFDKLTNVGVRINNLKIPRETSPQNNKSYGMQFGPLGLPKEVESYVKREGANRYSERAIDVPGEETRVKDDEKENDSLELTSVQVHRSTQEIDEEEKRSTVEPVKFINRNQENADNKPKLLESRPKFGVKVLPEIISFKEKNVKSSNPELKDGKIKKSNLNSSTNKSNKKMEADNIDSISSISILSSKKEDEQTKIRQSSSSSEEDHSDNVNKINICQGTVAKDQIDMQIESEASLIDNSSNKNHSNIEYTLPESVEFVAPPNITFFSHAHFPQSPINTPIQKAPAVNDSETVNIIDEHQEEPLENAPLTHILDSHPVEMGAIKMSTPWSNEGAASGESTPEHELDDATLSEINATDATKKRKYRYMLANSSILLPDSHHVEDDQLSGSNVQELWENQSDEVKSLSLKVKSPNQNVENHHNGSINIEDESFYSANMSSGNLALDDIEVEQVGNVSDEKKIKVFSNNAVSISTDVNDTSVGANFETGELTDSSNITENSADGKIRNNPRKISFTEFALSDAIPIDMTSLSFNASNNEDDCISSEIEPNGEVFGSVFGFQGFKNHVNNTTECELDEDCVQYALNTNEIAPEMNSGTCDTTDQSGILSSSEAEAIERYIDDAQLSKTGDIINKSSVIDVNKESSINRETKSIEECKKAKSKRNFGFRGLSRSSSDTDEDKGRVSSDPTGKPDKKSKLKNSLPFKFRSRSRSSDSDDSTDHRKVELDPSGIDIVAKNTADKSEELKLARSRDGKDFSIEMNKADLNIKTEKAPKLGLRKYSDSEDDLNESKVNCDPKGPHDKSKDSKSKSLKLGFKGFKNLKGKIQTEINKIRQESSVSDDESNTIPSKDVKQTDKSQIKSEEDIMKNQTLDMLMMEHAANAVKENRGKVSRKSSSSTFSSEEEGDNQSEQRKKKKTKSKKKIDKSRIVTTGVMQVELPSIETNAVNEVNEVISAETRSFKVDVPTLNETHNGNSPIVDKKNTVGVKRNKQKYMLNLENETQTSPRYVVKTEMVLTPTNSYPNSCSIDDVFDKVTIERKIPRPMLMEERSNTNIGTDTDGGSYGSDSDMDHALRENISVNLTVPSKRPLTDSEELKRKTASLGDLSRIHDGLNSGSILERAVSLDLNATTDNQGGLHVKRLKLPDSSATSIDEVDEKVPYSPMKLEQPIRGLKSASRWGTLEEALQLSNKNSIPQYHSDQSVNEINGLNEYMQPNDILSTSVSNIEISGGCGPSITSLSSNEDLWNSIPYDTHPLSEIIPNSKGKTTITLQNNASHYQDNHYKSDSSIVIVPGSLADRNEFSNVKVQIPPLSGSTPDVLLISNNINSDEHYPGYNYDLSLGTHSPNSAEHNSNMVTLTMISAEDSNTQHQLNFSPSIIPARPNGTQPSISPDLHSFDSGISAPVVTVNNDWSQCDPDVNVESSDLNSSDEFITPGGSPQKSMTQISLDGVGVSGYMVQDGEFLKTVIISNPDLIS